MITITPQVVNHTKYRRRCGFGTVLLSFPLCVAMVCINRLRRPRCCRSGYVTHEMVIYAYIYAPIFHIYKCMYTEYYSFYASPVSSPTFVVVRSLRGSFFFWSGHSSQRKNSHFAFCTVKFHPRPQSIMS